MTAAGAGERVKARLGLDDDELCDVLGLSPVQLLAGEADLLPQTAVLDELLRATVDQVSEQGMHGWVRASGPAGTPLEHLLRQDYAAFEDALETLLSRGFVVRKRDR